MLENYLFDEINNLKYIFLVNLTDDNDCDLHIQICGSSVRPSTMEDNQDSINKFPEVKDIIQDSDVIEMDTSTIYDINFKNYLSYSSRYEMFANYDDMADVEKGILFRIYKNSKFLEYLKVATIMLDDFPYKHYQLICEWQIIDIVSYEPPTISKIQFGK